MGNGPFYYQFFLGMSMSAMFQVSGNFTNQGFLLVIRVHEKRIGLILPETNVAVAPETNRVFHKRKRP